MSAVRPRSYAAQTHEVRPGVSPRLYVGLAVAVAIEAAVLLLLFGAVFMALYLLAPAS